MGSARPLLTVFTPTYNRAHCLGRAYDALCRQTSKDFLWLVIDDGSTDGTRALVEDWQREENEFEIQYAYKENGGLYTAYNLAISLIETELGVCVDSDDYLTDNAVELISKFWAKHGGKEYAGIVGLDCTADGCVIGDPLPDQKCVNLTSLLLGFYSITNGDRKNVVRTDAYRAVAPMPEFPGEKDFNPHYMHLQISLQQEFLVLNEKLCVVERESGGMTDTVFQQYLRSPRSFRMTRLLDMSLPGAPLPFVFKKAIHYTSSCILCGEPCVSASPKKVITVLAWPFGLLLTCYLRIVVSFRNRGASR